MKYQNLYRIFFVLAVASYFLYLSIINFGSWLKVKEFFLSFNIKNILSFYHFATIPPFKTRKCVLKLLAMGLCGGTNTNLLNSCFAYQDINFISPTPCSFGWMFLYLTNAELASMNVLWRPRIKMQIHSYTNKNILLKNT